MTGTSRVLAQHGSVLVADKPPGVPTLPEPGFSESLASLVASELGLDAALLHAVNRLDVGVSGTVVFSRRDRGSPGGPEFSFERRYIGATGGVALPPSGCWSGPIGRGARGSWAVGGRGAKPALTRYATIERPDPGVRVPGGRTLAAALVAFELATGRTHQIRVHAAAASAPLLGDTRYGGVRRIVTEQGSVRELPRILLHAARVVVSLQGTVLRAESPIPEDFRASWSACGGAADSFARALSATVPACE